MSEQSTVPDKMVPHNTEAEQAVLGALLIDPDAIFKVNTFLHPPNFYVERHQWIYDAILTLHERREAIDFVTLCDELERRERLAELGGAAYLTGLVNATRSSLRPSCSAGGGLATMPSVDVPKTMAPSSTGS